MHKLFFIIGAPGSGKTTAIEFLEKGYFSDFKVIHFDKFPIPNTQEIKEKYGDFKEWQRTHTREWIKKVKDEILPSSQAIIEGHSLPEYIEEAFLVNEISFHEVILIDCADAERKWRLIERAEAVKGNPEAIEKTFTSMRNHAQYLRNESKKRGYKIFDTTHLGKEEMAFELLRYLKDH